MADTFHCLNCHKTKPIITRVAVRNKRGQIMRYKCAECAAKATAHPVLK